MPAADLVVAKENRCMWVERMRPGTTSRSTRLAQAVSIPRSADERSRLSKLMPQQARSVWLVCKYLLGHKIVFGEAQVRASPR
jgi:hypothetical protein